MKNTLKQITLAICLISATYGIANRYYVFENKTNIPLQIGILRGDCAQGNIENYPVPANKLTTIFTQRHLCCVFNIGFVGTFNNKPFATWTYMYKQPIISAPTIGLRVNKPYNVSYTPTCDDLYVVIKMVDNQLIAFIKDHKTQVLLPKGVNLAFGLNYG